MSHAYVAEPGSAVRVLSQPRLQKYVAARPDDLGRALALYGWNADVSAALMLPAHFAEVSVRNAVSEALTMIYGEKWPWNPTFVQSLPSSKIGYNPRRDLQSTAKQQPTTGKVIAELKFVFWQTMFTARHKDRIWSGRIQGLFPQALVTSDDALRDQLYGDLETIRTLRNRTAHHEPIFLRKLDEDLATIL